MEAERHVPPAGGIVAAFSCTASLEEETLACEARDEAPSLLDPALDIVGGQGLLVQLTSSEVYYDNVAQVFYADVTIQNLMSRPLGTPDGSTVTGVRVFFHSGPSVTDGTGTVSVRNADGTGTFTGTAQPYHEYMEMLGTSETSAAKTWEWDVPNTVLTFVFEVFVEAETPSSITLEWEYESPPFEFCVGPYTWYCFDDVTFKVTDGSGEVWVSAAEKASSGTYPVVPDRVTTSFAVSPRKRYTVSLTVSFWGGGWSWPIQPPNWPCARIAIASPAAPGDTVFKEVRPRMDSWYDPPQLCCSPEYEIFHFGVRLLGDADTARAGDWEATAAFGDFVFTVNDDGSAITSIEYTFDDYNCAGTVKSGSVSFAGDWPITEHQFSIENADPADGDTYRIDGEFAETEVDATGTWELEASGSTCSGTWEGHWNLAPTATINAPADGASYPWGETISFSGSGTDPEDGALTGSALVWKSSLDGQIGTGESFTRDDLSVGSHRIVLTARDSEGWTGKDTANIAVEASESFTTGMWQALTGFGQFTFTVNPEGTGITQISYSLDHWTCGIAPSFWWGSGTLTKDYPGWPIADGQFAIENTLVDPDLTVAVSGAFETEDHASGSWTGVSFGTTCSGSWEGEPATKLFLRSGSTPFLSTEPDPSNSHRTRHQSGGASEFTATLDDAIPGDAYTFWFWLRADSGGVAGGQFDVSLLIDRGGAETELASTTIAVPADSMVYPFLDTVTGVGGGVPGDQLTLRITYDGEGWGDLIHGGDYDSHVIVPHHITVSAPSASTVTNSLAQARAVVTHYGTGGRHGLHFHRAIRRW